MLRYLTAGESHGQGLIAILDGIPAGLSLLDEDINQELFRRQQGYGRGERMKIEKDQVKILSGVRRGETLGSPIALWIRNRDWENWKKIMNSKPPSERKATDFLMAPRPGHADLVGVIKYAREDIRDVLERASARETAIRVAVGTVCRKLLKQFEIKIYSRVIQIGPIRDNSHSGEIIRHYERIEKSLLRCSDEEAEKKMVLLIDQAKEQGDTLGGVFEILVTGLPLGLGSYVQWDLKLDANLTRALMSIQAIIGVEIGSGFSLTEKWGSQAQDEIFYDNSRQSFYRRTNHAGGIEGGITNGEPVIMRAAMKPLSTLRKPLSSIDIRRKTQVQAGRERSDVCAVPAASVIGEAVVALEIARVMQDKFAGDSLSEMKRNYLSYCQYLRER